MTISVLEARERVRTYLQDLEYVRWGKHEINQYLHEAAEDFVSRVGYPIVSKALQSEIYSTARFDEDPGFVAGEVITGGTSGTTATVVSNGTSTTFDTLVGSGFELGETVTSDTGSGSLFTVLYSHEVDLPEVISKLTHIEVDGLEVPIVTESEMRHYAIVGALNNTELVEEKLIKIFGSPTNSTVKWREQVGACKAIVVTSATADKFRIYPIPDSVQKLTLYGVYRPLHASDIIPFQFLNPPSTLVPVSLLDNTSYSSADSAVNSMTDSAGTIYTFSSTDTLVKQVVDESGVVSDGTSYTLRGALDFRLDYEIDRKFMNILVYGALERAYLKEHDLRNAEKSEYYRQKKEVMTQEAVREDALNPASISGGINFNRLTTKRKWQYQFN